MAKDESYVGAKDPKGPYIRYDTGVAFIIGSSVLRTVAALLPIRTWSLSTVKSTALLESTVERNYVCVCVCVCVCVQYIFFE